MGRGSGMVTVSVDISDVIDEIDTEDLEQELASRGYQGGIALYDKLYVAVATGDDAARDQVIRLLIWENLGRLV